MTTPAYSGDILALSQAIDFDPQTVQQVAESLAQHLDAQMSEFAPALQNIPGFLSGGPRNRKAPENYARPPATEGIDITQGDFDFDPQTMQHVAESLSQYINAQTGEFAPAFFPGGMYNRTDPETGERLPGPEWGDMTQGGFGRYFDSLLGDLMGGMGGDLGGLMTGMGEKMDSFLKFFQDLAAALSEALDNLGSLGTAIATFADLAAQAANSITSALGMKSAPVEDTQASDPRFAAFERRRDMAQKYYALDPQNRSIRDNSADGDKEVAKAQPPMLDNIATWVQIIVDKFEPLLQEIRDSLQVCSAAVLGIQAQLFVLPGAFPQQEDKGILTDSWQFLIGILGGFLVKPIAAVLNITVRTLGIIMAILAGILYVCDKFTSNASLSLKDNESNESYDVVATDKNLYGNDNLIPNESTTKNFEPIQTANIAQNSKYVWPDAFSLSGAAPMFSNMGTTNNLSDFNNLTIYVDAPQASTPDLIAGHVVKELENLGMSYNYPIRG